MYDFIIGGRFKYREITPYNIELEFEVPELVKQIQKCFLSKMFGGYTAKELSIYPIMIHLFLSMLPLHCDNIIRQKVMLANALRLYSEFKRKY